MSMQQNPSRSSFEALFKQVLRLEPERTLKTPVDKLSSDQIISEMAKSPYINLEAEYICDRLDYFIFYLVELCTVDHLKPEITTTKLHKGLYLMWANYAAFYGQQSGLFKHLGKLPKHPAIARFGAEDSHNYTLPPQLFPAKFIAGADGPIVDNIHEKFISGFYCSFPDDYSYDKVFDLENPVHQELKCFVDAYFVEHICQKSDAALQYRTQLDRSYRKALEDGEGTEIDQRTLLSEYIIYHLE